MPINLQYAKIIAYLAVFIAGTAINDSHAQPDDEYYDPERDVIVQEYDFTDEPVTVEPDYDDSDYDTDFDDTDVHDADFDDADVDTD